jgi:hypothetical protein
MKRQFISLIVIATALLLATAGCSPVAPLPTAPPPQIEATPMPAATLSRADISVTMVAGTCKLEGTREVYPDTFSIAFVGGDQSSPLYGLAVVSLTDGKTLTDLQQWPSAAQPPWVRLLSDGSVLPETRVVWSVHASENPVFIVCFTSPPDKKVAVLGPIEIALLQAKATQTPTPRPTAALPPADIAVRISGDGCKLEAPKPVYPATFTIALVGEANKAGYSYGLTVISLAEGKTLEDLKQTKGTSPPAWVTVEGAIGGDPGVTTQATVTVSKGPIYMVCWTQPPERAIGRLGPVEIAK